MTREIKFRAWTRKEMIYQCDNTASAMNGLHLFSQRVGAVEGFTPPVMQYTGLKDKNDKEIYEGDIVNYTLTHDTSKKVIKSEIENFKYAWRLNRLWLLTEINQIEVIGNIYQNPELI